MIALATPHGTTLDPDPRQYKEFTDPEKWDLRPAGSEMTLQLMAGTNNLASATSGLVCAGVHAKPGQATPMIMVQVGYPEVHLDWNDVSAGDFALTVCVTNSEGLGTVSAPIFIKVVP